MISIERSVYEKFPRLAEGAARSFSRPVVDLLRRVACEERINATLAATASRENSFSPASTAAASRVISVVAASTSSARSARTDRIRGWSTSVAPNALRCRVWWMACTSAAR